MTPRHRIQLAFLVAPLCSGLVFAAFSAITWNPASDPGYLDQLRDAVSTLLIYWLFGIVTALAIGVPAYFLYSRRGWQSWLAYALGGIVIGGIPAIILGGLGTYTAFLSALCVVAGLLSSLAFRAIAFHE